MRSLLLPARSLLVLISCSFPVRAQEARAEETRAVYETEIDADVTAVWEAFTTAEGLRAWTLTPALDGEGLGKAALNGAILGLVAYATYDLTNQATLRDWPLSITLADIPWGAFVTAIGASAGFLVASRIG